MSIWIKSDTLHRTKSAMSLDQANTRAEGRQVGVKKRPRLAEEARQALSWVCRGRALSVSTRFQAMLTRCGRRSRPSFTALCAVRSGT